MRGDLEGAKTAIEQIPPTTENHVHFTFATAFGTIVAAYLDDREMIATWFEGFGAIDGRSLEIECGAGFAEILVRRGRLDEAAALLHCVIPDCELPRGNVLTFLAIGRYGAWPDRKRAREYLARAAAGPIEFPERAALTLFDAFECQRNDRAAEAATLAHEAAAGFHRLRMPLLEAAAREVAGDVAAALALYRLQGAVYDVRRLAGDEAAEVRAFTAREGSALSPRQHEVASLAARGHSNLEIARAFSISHKTVEKHLASVFHKLGISSRRELRRRAER